MGSFWLNSARETTTNRLFVFFLLRYVLCGHTRLDFAAGVGVIHCICIRIYIYENARKRKI